MADIAVSAIMPTADRRAFVPAAIAAFLAQTRQDAELLILDDGADRIADLVPPHPRVRYLAGDRRAPVGVKRNRLCALARGDVVVHWDDDDWHAPDRLARQADALAASGAAICGLAAVAFLDADGGRAWDYRYGGPERWVYGASLAYSRAYWRGRPFPELACGEDTQWIFAAPRGAIHVLDDLPESLLVARIHSGNASPKQTGGPWWRTRDPAPLVTLTRRHAATATAAAPAAEPSRPPLANVYAALVHERPECAIDLIRNLRACDRDSPILLYDGSARGDLIDPRLPWQRWGVEIVPAARPMRWGELHGFALDCIAHLRGRAYEAITIVDSDQMMLRPAYTTHLARSLAGPVGLLSPDPAPQGPDTRIPPAATAHAERALWRPFLRRFTGGEDKFVHWTFWPGTVIGADAARAVADLFDDPMVQDILSRSRLWATEEILFPTFAALLGFEVARNPAAQDWTRYRRDWSVSDLDQALARPDAFFIHPVPRVLDHPLRVRLRDARAGAPAIPPEPAGDHALVASVRAVQGWLEDEEALQLIVTARAATARPGAAGRMAEIGSFCGKASVLLARAVPLARLIAIDRFDGLVGSRESGLEGHGATRARFDQALAAHGVADRVETWAGDAAARRWRDPIDLLLIDGLHDYAAVASDVAAFDHVLPQGARIAFHDYADYFPGVVAYVDELLAAGGWALDARAGSLVVLRRTAGG